MQQIEQNGFTYQQIIDSLHSKHAPRQIRFTYNLLDKDENKIGELDSVESGEVAMASLAQIKRTAKFRIKDKGEINWLTDRIQPVVEIKVGHGWASYPVGIFLPNSPTKKDRNNRVYREVEAYDGLIVLREDRFVDRHTIQAGTTYYQAVIDILDGAFVSKRNIEYNDAELQNDIEFEPGKEKLFAINELLGAINYTPIHVDVHGFYTSSPYKNPNDRSAEYTYRDDQLSVTYSGMEEELDLFNVPNRWVAVLSDPEREPLVSSHTNTNPDSPTSTISRGRIIVDYREVEQIANQQALDAYVQRIAFEASQVYGRISFETAIMPFHDYSDMLELEFSQLGISGKYVELNWSFPLVAGGRMKHEVRKVIQV